jgi:membrane associated rhomboid family serine protease
MRYKSNQGFLTNGVWLIIAVNFLIFVVTSIRGDFIINLGLVPILLGDQPWTILTAMFVHANIGHILGNMITLYFFGTFLTGLIGQNKFLLVYFIGGILGNALFYLLAPPVSLAVGASGAVYAIAGALVMMVPKLRVNLYFILPMPLWVVVLVFFVIFSFIPGVAWQAHMGGLATGLVAGYIFRRQMRRQGVYYRVF